MIKPNEIIVDNFAGGGGASEGMEMGLGCHVDIAINHDPLAIEMHKINHPETKHYCESVWDVDPVEACDGRPVGLAWFSPDCKHFSKAKGSKPVDKNIRGLAWVVVRWAALVSVRKFKLENVEEFKTWGPLIEIAPSIFKPDPERKGETFDAFIKCLTTGLPYSHPAWDEIIDILGDDFPCYRKLHKGLGYQVEYRTLAACDYGTPTTRKRLFLVARNDGYPIQFPEKTHGAKNSGLKPFKTAADIIDWSIPVKSIFDRPKPLAENTLKRIARGIQKFVIDNPEPFIVGKPGYSFITPFIDRQFSQSSCNSVEKPLGTVTAGGMGKSALVSPLLIQYYGSTKEDEFRGHGVKEPLKTLSTSNRYGLVNAFLIQYYGTSTGHKLNEPLHTITTKDRFGLVMIKGEKYQIIDIGMRMLQPHELFAAMGFPDDYIISHDSNGKKLSKNNQVARCGNAVCPPVAKALVEANLNNLQIAEVM